MELNRENLVTLVDEIGGGKMVVLDHWPGRSGFAGRCFFVMDLAVAGALQGGATCAVLSSRLPKILDRHRHWFDGFRTVGVNVCRYGEVLLTSESTAADRYCRRIAELFQIRCVVVRQLALEDLADAIVKDSASARFPVETVYCVAHGPIQADQLLGKVADNVYALAVSSNGNVEKALQQRLSGEGDGTRTFVLHENSLTSAAVRQRLLRTGAIQWLLLPEESAASSTLAVSSAATARPITLAEIKEDEYLIHWTRARPEAWPDQSEARYFDDLIFGTHGSKHGDVYSLCRILASQRIFGSANLTRDRSPVVCFSDVPLSQLREKTVFRKHLHRWDFLPFGIGIKKKVLEQRFGGRPVIYGDQKTWQALPTDDRPLFQIASSRDQKIDWRQEREWRVVGDVDLRRVGCADAVVFIGNEKHLEKLSSLSLFDLIVI